MKDFENILFCKTSKNRRIANISKVGELTLCLFIFSPTTISLCSVVHYKQYMKTIRRKYFMNCEKFLEFVFYNCFEDAKNKIFSKSFTIFVFVISLSVLICFEHSWSFFNSQYDEDLKNIQNNRKLE